MRAARQDGHRLHALHGTPPARGDQGAIAHVAQREITLVVAGCADGLAVAQLQYRQRTGLARMLDADAPRTLAMLAQRKNIAADVDQRIADALLAQYFGGAIQRITLGIAAQIEPHRLVVAAYLVLV